MQPYGGSRTHVLIDLQTPLQLFNHVDEASFSAVFYWMPHNTDTVTPYFDITCVEMHPKSSVEVNLNHHHHADLRSKESLNITTYVVVLKSADL